MTGLHVQVVRAIADAEETEPADLRISLQRHIETDAIQLLADHDSDSWSLQFDVPRHTVTVTGSKEIYVDGTFRRKIP